MIDRIAVYNERIKLASGFFNSLGLAFIILAFVRPFVAQEGEPFYLAAVTGLVMHLLSYYIVGYTMGKD